MAILAIGLIAVASVFPVAAYQQKRAIDDTQGIIVGHNVIAYLHVLGKPYFGGVIMGTNFQQWPPDGTPAYLNPVYVDPGGIYDYKLAARQLTTNSPIDVAVMVYRKAAGAALAPITTNVVATTFNLTVDESSNATTPGRMNPPTANLTVAPPGLFARPACNPGDRGQVFLYVNGTNGDKVTVLRTSKDDQVDYAPVDPPTLGQTQAYFLPQRAVAIVTGNVQ
jgi:hypothetical protein